MKITFKKMELRNFLSYGNSITTIDFNYPGLISLTGNNGCGKSVIGDALSYIMFGKPYRKIKINELVNRTNGKDLWVRLTFLQNDNKYRITRTLKPNTIKIEKWEGGDYIELELLSSSKLIQEEINKIFGIEYKTFKHIVSIASGSTNSKPFLTMASHEKRSLIESLFNLEVISEMSRVVKSDKSSNKHELLNSQNSVNLLTSLVEQTRSTIQTSQDAIDNLEENKLKAIETINNELQELKVNYDDNIAKLHTYKKALDPEITKKIKEKHALVEAEHATKKKDLHQHQFQVKHSKETIKKFSDLDFCHTCNRPVDAQHKHDELKPVEDKLNESQDAIALLEEEITELGASLEVFKQNITDLNAAKFSIEGIIKMVDTLDANIKSLETKRTDKEQEEVSIDISKLEDDLKTNLIVLEESTSKLNKCVKLESIYETADYLLSDSGIKTEFYNIVVPMFNQSVNDYVQKFALPVVITFDYEFNVTIKTLQGDSPDVNYFSFSEGEKRRIEIAILLSFIKMSKAIASWSTNVLIFDEILDTGIDSEGLIMMLDSIRDIATEEQLNVFVISHKLLGNGSFDKTMLITKDAMFSKLQVIS
jgi:DNA repair exonuclease SbcCD ATPase subunit